MSRKKKETENLYKTQRDLLTATLNKNSVAEWSNHVIERCCDYYKDLKPFKNGARYISFPLFCGKVCIWWYINLDETKLYYYNITKQKSILWEKTKGQKFLLGLALLIGFTVKTALWADRRTRARLASLLGIPQSQFKVLEKIYPIELAFEKGYLRKEEK